MYERVTNSSQWNDCLNYLSHRVKEQSFKTWLKPTRGEPGGNGIALGGRAAVVAHPVVVDFGVGARLVAADLALPMLESDVAADIATGADGGDLLQVPDLRLGLP